MEPLSISVSVLSIVSIVGLAADTLSQCRQIMEKFESATSDFAEAVHEVENLKSVLKSIKDSLRSSDSILDLNHEREHEHEHELL